MSRTASERQPLGRSSIAPLTVKIEGREWAVGLSWALFKSKDTATAAEARREAKALGADLFLTRPRVQYATASTRDGYRRGMPSLAAGIAEAGESNFLGAFRLEDRSIYLIAIIKGDILPGVDRVIADEHNALDMFTELYAGSEWPHIVAPQDWGIDGAQPTQLSEMILANPSKVALTETSRQRLVLITGAMALAAVLTYGGYSYYTQMVAAERLAAQAAEAARLAAARRLALRKQVTVYPPPPWRGARNGAQALLRCLDVIRGAPDVVPGWSIGTLTCDGSHLAMTLTAVGGTVNWIRPYVDQLSGAHPAIAFQSQRAATVIWSVPQDGIAHWHDERGNPPAQVHRYLISQFSEMFETPVLTPPVRPVITAMRGGKPVQVSARYTQIGFTLQTMNDVLGYVPIMARLQNFVLNSVKLTIPDHLAWTINGRIYHDDAPAKLADAAR